MIRVFLFDWGDTLMIDFKGVPGKMCGWAHVEAVAGAGDTLAVLAELGSIYIATAATESGPDDIRKAFARVKLDQFITGYFCKANTGFVKPEPSFYRAILKSLDQPPSSVTMVGDSLEKDILPCLSLGMNCVWLNSSGEAPPEGVLSIGSLVELLGRISQ